jgi:hypothetical protein
MGGTDLFVKWENSLPMLNYKKAWRGQACETSPLTAQFSS